MGSGRHTSGCSKQKRSSPQRCQGTREEAPKCQSSSSRASLVKAATNLPRKMLSQAMLVPLGTVSDLEAPGCAHKGESAWYGTGR